MTTTPEQFQSLLEAPEGSHLEFKRATSGFHFEKLVDYCVAIANEGGGKVILGVSDRRPRKIVGSGAFAEPGRAEAGLHQRLGHRVPIEEIHHQGHRVLIVHVPSRLPGTAWSVNGRYLKRAGDDIATLGDTELRAIFAETGPDFSAEPSPATVADLAPEATADFRTRWSRKTGSRRISQLDDLQLLNDAELLVDGHLTYAALILFGKRAALGRHLAQAEVVFEYRSSEASGPAQDREEYREGFFLFHDALWQKINLRNDRQSYQDGLFRYDIPTFDESPVREALLNAVVHRDYRLGGSVFVRQYARRLELVSPGGFPAGITPENILDQQNPRNRRLAEALARCGLVERSGQGMNLMVESAIRQSKPLPSFAGSAVHEVRLTLEGSVQNPAFIRFIERLGEERLQHFSTWDFLALDAICRDQPLTEPMRARLPVLIEAGAIEVQGRGRGVRYHLSQAFYAAIGQKGVYTRRKGLDHETNKALLMKHLVGSAESGSPMAELLQVLPALSRAHVKRLLRELADEGRARMSGVTRSARWFSETGEQIGSHPIREPIR
ncbi:MAG: transcriptional regulator [Betaproteobacteria bacterium RIFCSPLOWO2_02_FULL_65_24]|nr:MAG: transcriptional regulator [Betaproteobacteria bacterium RIFCSPLOWO2_02_FULL_65_24]